MCPHLCSLVSVSCIEIIVQVKILILSSVRSNKYVVRVAQPCQQQSDYRVVHLNYRSYNTEIVQLQSGLKDNYNNFSEKYQTRTTFSELIIGRFFPSLVLVRSLWSSFIDSFSSAQNTLQHFARFWRLF